MQRHLGPPQDEQQLVLVLVQPRKLLVQRHETSFPGEHPVELGAQRQRRRRRALVGLRRREPPATETAGVSIQLSCLVIGIGVLPWVSEKLRCHLGHYTFEDNFSQPRTRID